MQSPSCLVLPLANLHHELEAELKQISVRKIGEIGPWWQLDGDPSSLLWQQVVWHDITVFPADSISGAAKELRRIQKATHFSQEEKFRWSFSSHQFHRRTQLVADAVRSIKNKKLHFLEDLSWSRVGGFLLSHQSEGIASARTSSILPNGVASFIESAEPPSRAYLKLWELFTVHFPVWKFRVPRKEEKVCELGAAPGGWTWVLLQLGCKVTAIDRSNLEIAKSAQLHALVGDAFRYAMELERGAFDWVLSDLACEPKRALELVSHLLNRGVARNFVITLKFQGQSDLGLLQNWLSIPNSKLVHLHNNKHELTWVCCNPE